MLLGVVFSALQGGLGEASCLAMCTFFDSRLCHHLLGIRHGVCRQGSHPSSRGHGMLLRLAFRLLCICTFSKHSA